ncbi:hypothetical protein EXIGLDRAFT_648236 [Exidia glandulosa HHB12029]|uniref:Tetratricopeptide SHNi-TPR domain-containing protein n=1 Tax=Exidia glandulosa HHB12029 TaxID=1314781 RepID=A0A165H6E2_EXIGL|nr:hypothetical protein EXIGLDRAFT_648236 [Exidia glandulosa HHB12029]
MADAAATNGKAPSTIELAVELARKAAALRKWEEAVEHYSQALEIVAKEHGENIPAEHADLYFAYGKALLENAISSNAVLGRADDGAEEEEEDKAGSSKGGANKRFHFGGDAEEDEEDAAVDLLGDAEKAVEEEERAAAEDDDEDEEPEDDFAAAWEVLDVARTLYEKSTADDDLVKLKLADTFIALGDISLETEKFDQAISDFEAGLKLKQELLPLASRQIAEAHYKLSIALDLTSGRLQGAIEHAQGALSSLEARVAELKVGLEGQAPSAAAKPVSSNGKGKGKATATGVPRTDLVENMSRGQIEAELKDVTELMEEVNVKIDELKNTSPEAQSAFAQLESEMKQALGGGSSGTSSTPAVVNDLTGMVKRKKDKAAPAPAPETNGAGTKRKADDEVATNGDASKKARVEDIAEAS